MRQAAIGVAAGGISIAIMKAMGMLDLVAAMPTMRQAAAMQPAAQPVPNAITRDDLQQALTDAARKNNAQLKELEQQHFAQLCELRRAYARAPRRTMTWRALTPARIKRLERWIGRSTKSEAVPVGALNTDRGDRVSSVISSDDSEIDRVTTGGSSQNRTENLTRMSAPSTRN